MALWAINYYRDSGHVAIQMRSQNCHTSTSHVKKRAKMASKSGDCGEIVLDEKLDVLLLEGSKSGVWEYFGFFCYRWIKRKESKFCVRFWVAKKDQV